MTGPGLPTLREIESAESRLRGYFPPTPLEYSRGISEMLGRETYLKLETFLPIRVFKLRGAMNKLLSLPKAELDRGVMTASSGNHGLAVAYASKLFGVRASVCVPETANPQKVRAIVEQGAELIRFGEGYDAAYEHARSLAKERGATFVHAFNDGDVIAGQGTCGLEVVRQLPEPSSVVVPIGGGGLISGIAIAVRESSPRYKVYGAETVAIPSMYESLEKGRRLKVVPRQTIADGMQAATPGELTFEAVRRYVERVGLVTDEEIENAIFDLLSLARVLAEPSGASSLAAAKGALRGAGEGKWVLVISGGNISLDLLGSVLRKREGKRSAPVSGP